MSDSPLHRPPTTSRLGAPKSPCILVCQVDPAGTCLGCGRTLDEIGRWGSASAEEQWRIADAAEVRLAEIRAD